MPGIWFALRKSLPFKSQPSDLDSSANINPIPRKKRSASVGCLANLKDAIHGSKKHNRSLSICSPVVDESRAKHPNTAATGNGTVICNLRSSLNKTTCPTLNLGPQFDGHLHLKFARELDRSWSDSSPLCLTCGEQHERGVTIGEPHRLSKHRVSELVEGDSSRKIVEIICQTRQEFSIKSKTMIDEGNTKIERILKVHNTQSTLTWFEEYREMVKVKASRQSNRYEVNPRCLADGNELLMFYATTVLCSLATNGFSILCKMSHCGVCRILRNGFFTRKDFIGHIGIFASSNSERALRFARDQEGKSKRNKALFVCRVIAGKIHSPVRKTERGFSTRSGFDSLAWKVGRNRIAEELILLNPRALLPCFVVMYKI